ncbi:Kinesin-like protein KIN-14B [Lathyrus oleraceus]|uniref:Kinesin-like protein KIN-14B n=1 Tax=Pisum sativum TaxID=3888 RepID=A0A9D4VIG2_PEA|nr:Kinesin-like protein KIN-14B [Pisum sativum]
MSALSSPLTSAAKNDGTVALVKSGSEIVKTTPADEHLTAALNDFDPDQYEGHAAISDGTNKLLMLVLAAVIKAGASREHEILAEIRDSVFSFIRKMEPKRVMDTMLVSRVRFLYIRSLLARSPGLQSIKIQGFKVNLKPEKKSKFSSVVLKIRGIDQEIWRQSCCTHIALPNALQQHHTIIIMLACYNTSKQILQLNKASRLNYQGNVVQIIVLDSVMFQAHNQANIRS